MLNRLSSNLIIPRLRESRNASRTRSLYEPLPAGEYFRVLKLHPGEPDDMIECSLETVTFQPLIGNYDAISYVWGHSSESVNIRCNGKRITITTNLADALLNFRDSLIQKILWADALCINQQDDEEKGSQVAKMSHVFANARRVLVWLGSDPDEIAEDTFDLIRKTNKYFGGVFLQNGCYHSRMPRLEEPYPICMDEVQWAGVKTLLSFPWFSRVWTVQETAVARDCLMFWGSNSIDIADVFEICIWRERKHDFTAMSSSSSRVKHTITPSLIVANVHSQYRGQDEDRWQNSRAVLKKECDKHQQKEFIKVLRVARELEATDPRDRVYAFLGCPSAKDEDTGWTVTDADYTIPVEELYVRVACSLLQRPTEGYRVLSAIKHRRRKKLMNSEQPSWAPGWDKNWRQHMHMSSPRYWYRAGGSEGVAFKAHISGKLLTLSGVHFDQIRWVSLALERKNFGLDPQRWNSTIRKSSEPYIDILWKEVSKAAAKVGIEISAEAFTMTLFRGYPEHKKRNLRGHHARFQAYRAVIRSAIAGAGTKDNLTFKDRENALDVMKSLEYVDGARLVLTNGGRLGLVPDEVTEVGDICCIFFGAMVPFILTPARKGKHKLVGECYIHGVMDGEVIDRLEGREDLKQIVLE